jgi:uncharacterized protein YwgA
MSQFDLNRRATVLAELIKALHAANSWCGETHIQKAVFLLQNFGQRGLDYDFVLYKHGPYSFDLAADIASLRGANLLEFAFRVDGYGPSVQLTALGVSILLKDTKFVAPMLPLIKFIANWLGPHDVRYLERVATAYFIRQQNPHDEPYALAARLREVKPHISEQESILAVRQLEEKIAVAPN